MSKKRTILLLLTGLTLGACGGQNPDIPAAKSALKASEQRVQPELSFENGFTCTKDNIGSRSYTKKFILEFFQNGGDYSVKIVRHQDYGGGAKPVTDNGFDGRTKYKCNFNIKSAHCTKLGNDNVKAPKILAINTIKEFSTNQDGNEIISTSLRVSGLKPISIGYCK